MKESKGIKMCIFSKHLKRINCCCVFYVTRVEVWIVLYPLLYQSIILSLSLSEPDSTNIMSKPRQISPDVES